MTSIFLLPPLQSLKPYFRFLFCLLATARFDLYKLLFDRIQPFFLHYWDLVSSCYESYLHSRYHYFYLLLLLLLVG